MKVGQVVLITTGYRMGWQGIVVDPDWRHTDASGFAGYHLVAVDVPMDDGDQHLAVPRDWLRVVE